MMIPLKVLGSAKIGDIPVDQDHYYHVLSRTLLEVSEGGKVVAMIINNIM